MIKFKVRASESIRIGRLRFRLSEPIRGGGRTWGSVSGRFGPITLRAARPIGGSRRRSR